MTHTPTDALRLVPVPFNLLSQAAGLLDCEGYGPISSQLNAILAGSGLLSRGDLHTALMDAIRGDLMRQNPGAFTEENGNSTLAIPTSKAFLTVDVSSLAEAALAAAPASPLPEGGGWQNIITAPKDESWCVLLFRDDDEPVCGFWSTGEDPDWYSSEASSSSLTAFKGDPTHWMPLPSAPTGAK